MHVVLYRLQIIQNMQRNFIMFYDSLCTGFMYDKYCNIGICIIIWWNYKKSIFRDAKIY